MFFLYDVFSLLTFVRVGVFFNLTFCSIRFFSFEVFSVDVFTIGFFYFNILLMNQRNFEQFNVNL